MPSRSSGQQQGPQAGAGVRDFSGAGEISPGEPSRTSHERKTKQPRKLADWLGADVTEEEEWSALEGVTRVNSLLNLPRFLAGDKRRTGDTSQQHKHQHTS